MADASKNPFHVVLIEPEIPANTGNIGRTCVGLNAHLHLVGRLGFEITDRRLKRAGLDYWPHLNFFRHEGWDPWWKTVPNPERVFFFTTKAQKSIYDVAYRPGDRFVFGKETKGLGSEIIDRHKENCLRIPMVGPIRSLNLATSVAIVLFEAFRQTQNSPSA